MENTTVSFEGQHIYVGIDVHKRNWAVTIIIGGLAIKTTSMNPNPMELAQYLRRNYPGGIYKAVYEAGYCGFWISRELQKIGIDNIVVNPADVPSTYKEKRRKDDRIDSKKLAKELSVGHLTGIYIPSAESEALRTLSRLRIQLIKEQTRVKNRITSLLDFSGIKIPKNSEQRHWSAKYMMYLSDINFGFENKKITLNILIDNLQKIRSQIVQVHKELKQCIQRDEKMRRIISHLLSVPGIGFVTAVSLYTEIMDIRRFNKFDELVAYIGLAPDTNSSGETERIIGISTRRHNYLRSLLVEAAWMAVRTDSAMTKAFGKLAGRMSKERAIIRVAKKILSRIMYVWSKQQNYKYSLVS